MSEVISAGREKKKKESQGRGKKGVRQDKSEKISQRRRHLSKSLKEVKEGTLGISGQKML